MLHTAEACIGWPAEPACPVYGTFHGCKLPDGHTQRRHVCACGEASLRIAGVRLGEAVPACGTDTGYHRHRRFGETVCHSCRIAHAAAGRDRAWIRRSA